MTVGRKSRCGTVWELGASAINNGKSGTASRYLMLLYHSVVPYLHNAYLDQFLFCFSTCKPPPPIYNTGWRKKSTKSKWQKSSLNDTIVSPSSKYCMIQELVRGAILEEFFLYDGDKIAFDWAAAAALRQNLLSAARFVLFAIYSQTNNNIHTL